MWKIEFTNETCKKIVVSIFFTILDTHSSIKMYLFFLPTYMIQIKTNSSPEKTAFGNDES